MNIDARTQRENEQRVAEEYLSSLSDLNCNSKPLINMLTMLAEENIEYAPVIVKVVEHHIFKVPPDFKLPILYLIDSIIKNVKSTYVQLFSHCIVNIFCGVFEQVNEKIRERMYALRQTWNEVFSTPKLYTLDVKTKQLDNNWPITARPSSSIHVNPNFLKTVGGAPGISTGVEEILQHKTRELLELKKRKLELELEATKKHLEEQEKQLSKTTEGIVQPVETMVPGGNLQAASLRNQSLPPSQIIPNIMAAGYMPPGEINPAVHDVRSGMYPNVRPFRSNMHPNLMNMQQEGMGPPVAGAGITVNNAKPRVHPVSTALLNTIRQRDPRLARKQQEQSHQSSPRQSEDSNDHAMGRSSKHSSQSKSKSSSSSSSSNSNNPEERRRSSSNKDQSKTTSAMDCDKDAFEIAPLANAFKRKSISPSASPKSNDKNRHSTYKSRTQARNKKHSRSPSPKKDAKDDVSRRSSSPTTTPEKRFKAAAMSPASNNADVKLTSTDIDKNEKRIEKSSELISSALYNMDVDLRPQLSTNAIDSEIKLYSGHKLLATAASDQIRLTTNLVSTTSANTVALSSPKVSFTIQKLLNNKLDKSSENLTAKSSLTATNTANDVMGVINAHNVHDARWRPEGVYQPADQVSRDDDNAEHKKHSSLQINDEDAEPTAKKNKSSKLDTLFGSEDVDLRKLMPTLIRNSSDKGAATPPPPPVITSAQDSSNKRNDSWNLLKGDATSPKKSSLDDVRAKLAKTAKLSKLSKTEKTTKEFSQRLRLVELQNMNEDTQEANDEKIRTMVAQAQELLEAKSITQEQYNNLLKTVMSINEVNKLKIAKRQESLNAIRKKLDEEDTTSDAERNAAREAVLKKRIPKLNKTQTTSNEGGPAAASHNENCNTSAGNSPRCDDEPLITESLRTRNNRDKRTAHRVSKWGERVTDTCLQNNAKAAAIPPRAWNSIAAANIRGFCGNPPTNRLPTNMPLQWQMRPLPQFANNPMQTMRNMVLPTVQPNPKSLVPKPCNSIDNPQEDLVRTITIDGTAKEIRFYDQVAIVFMEADQPREIGFQNGQRSICIDNHEPVLLQFNDDYKAFLIGGETFRLRFGFPSRELYIDEHWYEIYFGGPPITVPIRNQLHMLKAEGPPPQVNIGPLRRDLVAGKINMIVDAQNVIPLYLDARIQTFFLGGMEHSIQFADNLLTVLLDNKPIRVEYGGLPRSLFLGGRKYFVRFGALPRDVVVGKVQIKDMIYVETQPPASSEVGYESMGVMSKPEFPLAADVSQRDRKTSADTSSSSASVMPSTALSSTINIDDLFQKLVSSGILKSSASTLPVIHKPSELETSNQANETTTNSSVAEDEAELVMLEEIKAIDLRKSESIKTRQAAIVSTLYSGMQCSSCGVRFPPEQTIKYSQHLDWHFRQNRRERDSTRKAHSRKWYYDLNDWVQYEEIEDLEEREKNFFEAQQNDLDNMDDVSNQRSANSPIPNCPAKPDDVDRACDMCHEKFEQFYNEEHEEWYLRCAIRVTDKIYHPLCYEDYKASLNPPKVTENENKSDKNTNDNEGQLCIQLDDDNAVDIQINSDQNSKQNIESKTITANKECCEDDDDDDDVIVLPNEEPLVTEIDDDDEDEYVPVNVSRQEMANSQQETLAEKPPSEKETIESDIEIQEPHIPFTDLDTYEEKQSINEANSSDKTFMNVKIKQEPKEDDDDEDDGFEDVGTVLIAPEDISRTNYGNNPSPAVNTVNHEDSLQAEATIASPKENQQNAEGVQTDLDSPMDGNLETTDEHNLSVASLAPTVPLTNLVNKIKININKNTIATTSSSNSNASSSTSVLSIITTTSSNSNSNLIHLTEQVKDSQIVQTSNLTTVSTIPVLCGGVTTDATIVSTVIEENHITKVQGTVPKVVDCSSESVQSATTQQSHLATGHCQQTEVLINYELKPALQKVVLKAQDKVTCGKETSGLCSIM